MAQTVLRRHHKANPAPRGRAHIPHRHACRADLARAGFDLARQRQQKLVLPIARHPGNAQNLAAFHGKGHILQARAKGNGRGGRQPLHLQRRMIATPILGRRALRRGQRRAHHHLGQFPRGGGFGVRRPHHLAAPQNRRCITERPDFLQLVRDIQDRCPLRRQLAQGLEQNLHLLRRQHAGRLIHDQQLGVLQKTANDLHPLTLPGRQIAHHAGRVQRQAVIFRHRLDPRRQRLHRRRVFHAKGNVLGDTQRLKETEMLKHHRDTRGPRHTRGGRGIGAPLPRHLAAVGLHQTIDHLDHGRFARAVFPQKAMHLTFANGKADVRIGHHAGIGFGDALHLQKDGTCHVPVISISRASGRRDRKALATPMAMA